MGIRNNRMKKKIASKYVTDKNTISILSKSIEDLEKFEYAIKHSCTLINREKLHQFHLLSCDAKLLNSEYYKQVIDVFMLYQNPRDCKDVRFILCDPMLINSKFYPIMLKFLSINRDIHYTSRIINDMLIDNIMLITPELFQIFIFFGETTNFEICSILRNELINKEKVIDIISKLCKGNDSIIIEKQVKDVILVIRRILYLEDKDAIKVLLNYLYTEIDNKFEYNDVFSDKVRDKIIEQRAEIAKRRSLYR